MDDDMTIGMRLRALRRWRGMTLTTLGGLAGLSPSFLSRAERGERMLDRRSHISALAAALRVSETELTGGPHLGTDPDQAEPHSAVPALRAALTGNTLDDPAVDRARPLDDLRRLLFGPLAQARDIADYRKRGEMLAPLLNELHFHVATGDEPARMEALRLMVEACNASGTTLRHLGYTDLPYIAATRAIEAARILDDPVMSGQAAYLRVSTMSKPETWHRPLAVATKAAERLQAHLSSPMALQTYGMLHLSAALSAAAVHDPGLANEHLEEATETSVRTGENPGAWCAFGPTNVGIWRVAIAMEHGDYEEAVAMADTVTPEQVANRERQAWFHADKSRALAHIQNRRADAIKEIQTAERIAPQRIRNSTPVQETVLYLLGRSLTASQLRELRGIAARMGIPH